MSIRLLCVLLLILVAIEGRQLLMVHEIFRHGARYPIYPNNKDNSSFASEERELGELTKEGKHMQYVLGKLIYEKYWEQLFTDTPYLHRYHPSQIYVKTTNVNRTIESAEAQLLGLLENLPPALLPAASQPFSMPPMAASEGYQEDFDNQTQFQVYGSRHTDFHTIPIHMEKITQVPQSASYKYRANPYDEGDYLVKYEPLNCPNQEFWGKENLASEEARRVKNNEKIKAFLRELSSEVGESVKYEEAVKYIDSYYCELYMGRPYLEVFKDPEQVKTANFLMLSFIIFELFYTEDQVRTSNTGLLEKMLYNMKQRMIGKGPRLVLFSAHDTTILSFGRAMDFLNIGCLMEYFQGNNNEASCINQYPIFATNYLVELWQEDDLSHSISILYNGVERPIPLCGGKTSCTFAEFENWVKDFALSDPNSECGIRHQYLRLYVVIAVLSVVALVLLLIYFRRRLKSEHKHSNQSEEQKKGYFQHFQQKDPPPQKDALN